MYPIDLLSEDEIAAYERYVRAGFCGERKPVNGIDGRESLHEWNKSKVRLFHAFGWQLRRSIEIHESDDTYRIKRRAAIVKVYDEPISCYACTDKPLNGFILSIKNYCRAFLDFPTRSHAREALDEILSYNAIMCGKVETGPYDDVYHTKNGAERTFKCFRKTLESIGYFDKHPGDRYTLEKFRNAISDALSSVHRDATLTISIHPLDFLSISDNENDWTTCMSVKRGGGYRDGVIGLMNSDVAFVAYVESSNREFDAYGVRIPSKSWRVICYANKMILVVGKSYPYGLSGDMSFILDNVCDLFESTVGWRYTIHGQEYRDMWSVSREDIEYDTFSYGNKSIILYSNPEFYNDIFQDKDEEYWCCRNIPKHRLEMNVCGKMTCVACGKPLYRHGAVSDARKYICAMPSTDFFGHELLCNDCKGE